MRRQIKLRSLTGVKIFFMSKFFTSQVENSVKNLCHRLYSYALIIFCHIGGGGGGGGIYGPVRL